jgi:hypothetical protein
MVELMKVYNKRNKLWKEVKKIKSFSYKVKLVIVIIIFLVLFSTYIFGKKKFETVDNSVGTYQNDGQHTATNEIKVEEDKKEDYKAQQEAVETFKATPADGKGILVSGVTEALINSSFWTKQVDEDNSIIMNLDQISDFNKEIMKKVPAVKNLENYKGGLSKEELKKYINSYKAPTKQMYYSNGKAISQEFYNSIIDNTNVQGIKDSNNVYYGLSVKKTSIRSFPTETGVYDSQNSSLDRIQETGCEPCEPVIILHESKDKQWYFIQMYNYIGWVKADTIAIAPDKDTVFNYVNNKDFLMVTGKKIEVKLDNANREFALGTKLFLDKTDKDKAKDEYKVKIPERNSKGELSFSYGKVAKSQDLHLGYLPYTRYNIITEAFKFLGTEYDWGDKNSGRDCSSFILHIYETFGFKLPRNTSEQEKCSNNVIKFTSSDNLQKRTEILKGLKAGDVVYMPGHTMMYLGEHNGNNYIIHSYLGSDLEDKAIKQVVVTPLNSKTISLLGKLTTAVKYQFE